jgi:hypothetical protein
MSRPRKPTATLEQTGAFIKHPERKRDREGEPMPTEPLGDPPDRLGQEEKAIWYELSDQWPWAKKSDRVSMELIANLLATFRNKRYSVGELAQLTSQIGRMGGTPSDRTRIKVSNDQTQDPLESFLSRKPTSEVAQ